MNLLIAKAVSYYNTTLGFSELLTKTDSLTNVCKTDCMAECLISYTFGNENKHQNSEIKRCDPILLSK